MLFSPHISLQQNFFERQFPYSNSLTVLYLQGRVVKLHSNQQKCAISKLIDQFLSYIQTYFNYFKINIIKIIHISSNTSDFICFEFLLTSIVYFTIHVQQNLIGKFIFSVVADKLYTYNSCIYCIIYNIYKTHSNQFI